MMWTLYALLSGFGLDLLLGDPHSFPHPVVAIGKLISALEKLLRRLFPATRNGERLAGGILWVLVVSVSAGIPALLLWLCRRAPRPGKAFFVGFVLSMAGITLISVAQGEALDVDFIGCGLTLGAAFCWGAYGVCIELTEASGYTSLQVTRKVFFWGLLFSLPFIWLNRLDLSLDRFAKPEMLFCILYLGLGASALCFAAWNKAVVLIGSVATNVYIYLMPVITLVASALILREPVTLFSVGAIGLIVLGLWLSQRKNGAQA